MSRIGMSASRSKSTCGFRSAQRPSVNQAEMNRALREWEDRKGGGQAMRNYRQQPSSVVQFQPMPSPELARSRRYRE